MIASFNFEESQCLMENGQTVPIAFYDEEGEQIEDYNEAHSILIGPYFEWNGKKYDRKFAKIEVSAITLLTEGQIN